jgi:hypothetical protein
LSGASVRNRAMNDPKFPLIDGCQACARAGSAILNWQRDANGKFLGTSFDGMLGPTTAVVDLVGT